jgi:hypothetical protein
LKPTPATLRRGKERVFFEAARALGKQACTLNPKT